MINTLREHWGRVTVVGILLVLLIFVVPILGATWEVWSITVSQLIIAGFGALGTVVLAVLTVVTLQQNQKLVEERRKEREEPLQRDVLREIVWPAIDVIDENKTKLRDENFQWTKAGGAEPPGLDLERIAGENDRVIDDWFVDGFPDVTETLVEYDDLVFRLDRKARAVIDGMETPLENYLDENDIVDGEGEAVRHTDVLEYLLTGDMPARDSGRPNWWVDNKDEFKKIVWDNAEDDYEGFLDTRQELFNYSNNVRKSLIGVRKNLEYGYGISPNTD